MKDKHIVAFGGDALFVEPENRVSANFLFSLANKSRPKICFLPTASGDASGYVDAFMKRYSTAICEPSTLTLFNREIKDIRGYLLDQDIIYVGGGNTANMLAVWRVHGVESALLEAYENGVVMCGTSAGSLCWFTCGVTDSFGRDLSPIEDGLGIIKASNCPHYDSESLRQPQYHKFISEGLAAGYAADDGTALHFVNGKFVEAVGSKENTRAFYVAKEHGSVKETPIPVRFLG